MLPTELDLGPFRLLELAGRGATARVWRAEHRATGAPVAVKILTSVRSQAPALRDAFAREVRAVARLDHGAIIRLHDYGEVPKVLSLVAARRGHSIPPDAPYLVMDWQGGGTLATRQGRMRFAELRATLLTLLDALAHAHARGVIHRDLKPANVMLGDQGPVLSDFGLVFTIEGEGDRESHASGTPNYMAPEQVTSHWREFGPWSDLYALGCVTWALATGRAPYAGRGANKAMLSHLSGNLPDWPVGLATPPELEHWVRRLLARQPEQRFRFAADAAVALMSMPDGPSGGHITGPLPPEEVTTVVAPPVFMALDEAAWVTGAVAHTRPPMPADWRRPDPPWAAHLSGCGRSLAELREIRFGGRDAARDRLWGALGEVVAGRGCRVVLIEGLAGVGKTRLMSWLARRAHELGQADRLRVTHAPAPGPGHGLRPILGRLLKLDELPDADAGARVMRKLGVDSALAAAIVALGRSDLSAEVDGFRITLDRREIPVTLTDAIAAVTLSRPLVVEVDDAQWGEEALRWVQWVLTHRPELPVLFLCTVRTDALPAMGVAGRLIDGLADASATARLALDPLDRESRRAASAARLPLSTVTLDHLVRITAGNPLFAGELLRHWLHIDALVETPEGYALFRDGPEVLPPRLTDLLSLRLDTLLAHEEGDPRPALELAAVLGMVVDREEWAAVCAEVELATPERALGRLLDGGVVYALDPRRFVFAHTLVREALTDRAASGGRLTDWHLACVAGLRSRAAATGEALDPVRLAIHLDAAERPAEAFAEWQVAITTAENAWGTVTELEVGRVVSAARSARAMGLRRAEPAWIALKISWSAWLNTRKRGLGWRHARQAVSLALARGDNALAARALRQEGRCLRDRGELEAAERRLSHSVTLARAAGDIASLVATQRMQSAVAFIKGQYDLAEQIVREVLARLATPAVPHGPARRYQQMEAWNQLGEIGRRRGDLDAARSAYSAALNVLGDDTTYLPALIALNLALLDLEREAVDLAEQRARKARPRLVRAGSARYQVYVEAVLLACVAERGDARAWDIAWRGLAPAVGLDFVYLDVARLLDRAGRRAAKSMPIRAAAARGVAIRQYRALGRSADADKLAAFTG